MQRMKPKPIRAKDLEACKSNYKYEIAIPPTSKKLRRKKKQQDWYTKTKFQLKPSNASEIDLISSKDLNENYTWLKVHQNLVRLDDEW